MVAAPREVEPPERCGLDDSHDGGAHTADIPTPLQREELLSAQPPSPISLGQEPDLSTQACLNMLSLKVPK